MDVVPFLEHRFGGRWCGVRFGGNKHGQDLLAAQPMPFCKAVGQPGRWTIVLTPELVDCPGGKRSLGWSDDDKALAKAMAEKSGIDTEIASSIIVNTPKLDGGIRRVTVGTRESPDVLVSYAQPEAAMKLLREWQRLYGTPIGIETSGFMSVCGAVAVKAYLCGTLCISFGCPDARRHAGIGRDRLVIGLPMKMVARLWRDAGASHGAS